ncbi:DUF262 domain-containing protein [Roseomonas sp. PWR1]|uniref:DUF262 domain-containing protein n=1 Tax=Roseomonas nitratireducens TaxID=2820810 RepID=A0ABS4AZB5_9PROT|nr:DUF262 domain-containing protein [Neoroseomonas nitratireducens]MBP0466711.1 DUF262 domain-containing protein [Neoroseomonas nitratireducens]
MRSNFLDHATYTVAWFNSRSAAGELELRPPFQRNPVWTDKQKSYLIDTILQGYPIPEIYMQEYSDATGNQTYVIVDGQQRIRACLDFISGRYALTAEEVPGFAGLRFEELSESQKKTIFNYSFVVRKMPEVPDPELRSIFQRLNRNVVALNKQELRHATYWGEFLESIESIAEDNRWADFGVFTPNDFRRMLDIEFISEISIAYLHGPQNKKESLDRWYSAYEEEFARKDELKTMFNVVMTELHSMHNVIQISRWRKKSDFYTLFLVCAEMQKELPLTKSGRQNLQKGLIKFGTAVDDYIKGAKNSDVPSQLIEKYAKAVSRAASDLKSRRERREALLAHVGPVFRT